jgi:benzoyl-CoA 2,3-epoxidase subunit B
VIQQYLNFHYSVSLDLFGGETSTNVANYFSSGLKGRWQEERRGDDHVLTTAVTAVE